MTRREMEVKLAELEKDAFILNMKDKWTVSEFDKDKVLHREIMSLKEQIEKKKQEEEIRLKAFEDVLYRVDALGLCTFCKKGNCDSTGDECGTYEMDALKRWLDIKIKELKDGQVCANV